MRKFTLSALALLLASVLTSANLRAVDVPVADGVTVECFMSDFTLCTQIGPLEWAIPENTHPLFEPSLLLVFSVPFPTAAPDGTSIRILDPTNDATGAPCPQTDYPLTCVSDLVVWGSEMMTGLGGIFFASDTNSFATVSGNFPVGCTEDAVAGCSFSFNVPAPPIDLVVTVSSDGDNQGSSVPQYSDTITLSTVPEPRTTGIIVSAIGLIGIIQYRRKKARSTL
jgi:hypothetical protein